MSSTFTKTAVGTVLGGAMLVAGGLGVAHAAPPAPEAQTVADGKVSVSVTSPTGERIGILQDVSVANAFTLVNSMCPISGITEANLTDLDANGTAMTQTCGAMGGLSFTFSQNGAPEGTPGDNANQGQSEYAPGQNKAPGEPATPPASPPAGAPGQQGR